ncbi:hypothetical protein BKA69DRAFT_591898 [Paraphysoderma sedebokerense]|nr:hypothetical protein BKA69DRAFT_591898 [Paraphysoderma sedebokerense]
MILFLSKNTFSATTFILALFLSIYAHRVHCIPSSNSVVSPWYTKYLLNIPNPEPIIEAVSNSSHIFALDRTFRLYVFTVTLATGELGTLGNYDLSTMGAGVCCNDWSVWR